MKVDFVERSIYISRLVLNNGEVETGRQLSLRCLEAAFDTFYNGYSVGTRLAPYLQNDRRNTV